jgi:hypothetical protein
VCYEIFTSHYNYNHNEINNCLSCFLLCLSFHFLYYSRADRGQTTSTKWNWKVTHPSPPPPTICKMGLVCRHDSSTIFSVPRECGKFAQHCMRAMTTAGYIYLFYLVIGPYQATPGFCGIHPFRSSTLFISFICPLYYLTITDSY